MIYDQERREVAAFMRRLYRQKLTTTSGGNISRRIGAELIAITPAQLDKGSLRARDIAIVTLAGENLTPELKMTSEAGMHRRIYETCPQVGAIVHAHPVTASAFSAARVPIDCTILAESYALVEHIAIAPYALTGTPELAEHVAAIAPTANAILMENHGVTALGATLLQAFDRLELIETAAQLTLISRQLGGLKTLDAAQCEELDHLMGR